MANNNQLFDAALCAFIAGAEESRKITNATAASYAAIVNAGVAFATRVDSKIVADGTIVTPTTSETLAKVNLLMGICQSQIAGGLPVSTTAADYDTAATAIAALYTQGVLSLLLP